MLRFQRFQSLLTSFSDFLRGVESSRNTTARHQRKKLRFNRRAQLEAMPKTSAKKNDLGRMKFMCLMTGMAAPNVRPNVQGVVRHGPAEPAATPIAASPQVARKKQRVVDAVPHTRVGIDSPAFVRPLPDISELGTPVCLPRLPQATPPRSGAATAGQGPAGRRDANSRTS